MTGVAGVGAFLGEVDDLDRPREDGGSELIEQHEESSLTSGPDSGRLPSEQVNRPPRPKRWIRRRTIVDFGCQLVQVVDDEGLIFVFLESLETPRAVKLCESSCGQRSAKRPHARDRSDARRARADRPRGLGGRMKPCSSMASSMRLIVDCSVTVKVESSLTVRPGVMASTASVAHFHGVVRS